jgi:NifU-like protein
MTTIEKIDRINSVLEKDVRPLLYTDGGDVELVDLDGNEVVIRFKGRCAECGNADVTQYTVVEKLIRERVSPELRVRVD